MKRLAAVAALGATMGVIAPVASASAVTVTGPVVITNGTGVSFINSNSQIAAGSAWIGPQIVP